MNSSGSTDSFTKIVSKVERIKIEDESNGNRLGPSHPDSVLSDYNDEDTSNGNIVRVQNDAPDTPVTPKTPPAETSGAPKTPMTQGDRLNAIKASRTQPSPSHTAKSRSAFEVAVYLFVNPKVLKERNYYYEAALDMVKAQTMSLLFLLSE